MTEQRKTTGQPERRVLDAGAMRALSHPLRVRIYDLLFHEGPQTASTLAEILGESSGATSYHLRILARHNLIREVEGKRSGRERWWERPVGGIIFDNHAVEGSPAAEAALQVAVAEVLRQRGQELMDHFTGHIERESAEWVDASMAAASGINMTAAQTREVIDELQAVVEAAAEKYRGQKGPDVRRVSIRTDVFPLQERTNRTPKESRS